MAAEGQVDDGPPLTELESLQLKANQITGELALDLIKWSNNIQMIYDEMLSSSMWIVFHHVVKRWKFCKVCAKKSLVVQGL